MGKGDAERREGITVTQKMDTAQQFKKHANEVSYYDDGRGSLSRVVRIQEWVE